MIRHTNPPLKKLVLSFVTILLLSVLNLNAQELRLIDFNTLVGIENVAVYNIDKTRSTVSNRRGIVSLDEFDDNEILTFQHPGYQELTLRKGAINATVIKLSERIIKMKDVVVSANKWEQDVSEIPNEIISISAKEIAFNNSQTAADLLAQSGEIFVQKSQLGGGSPSLRGFAANSVLIVVDGVRMNNAIFRSGNLQNVISIDPNSLEGAEVILGPGSVIYGSDALGGVMDFHTKDPKFSLGAEKRVFGSAFTRYASANNERTGHLDFGIGGNKLAFFSSFSYSDFDDLKSGDNRPSGYPGYGERAFFVTRGQNDDIVNINRDPNEQIESGFESWNVIQKVSFKPSKSINLDYSFYLSNTSDLPRYDRLIQTNDDGSPTNAEWYYGPQRWEMHTLRTTITSKKAFFNQAKAIFAYQNYQESRHDRRFGNDRQRSRFEEVGIFSFNVDFDKKLNKGNLFYGIELLHNDVTSTARRRNIVTNETTETSIADSRYPDGGSEYQSASVYASYTHKITDKVILNSGLRFSTVSINGFTQNDNAVFFDSQELDLNNSAVNGSLGLVFNPNKNHKLSALFSTGFRSPNIDDVGKVFELDNNDLIIPNTTLKPEYSYNTEVSWTAQIENFNIQVTGFYTWLQDAIIRGNRTIDGSDSILFDGSIRQISSQVNADKAIIYGASLRVGYSVTPHLALEGTVNVNTGENTSTGEPLRHTTPLFGKTSVMYKKNKLSSEFFIEFNGSRLREDIPTAEIDDKPYLYAFHESDPQKDGSPGWYTLNLKGSYQLNQYFQISGGIENILDHHYRPYSSGISAPGRNFIIALRASLN